jgi:hypothetical protein
MKLPVVQLLKNFYSFLWNLKVHNPPLAPILNQINQVHTIPSDLSKIILMLSAHLPVGHPSGLFPSGFPTDIL